MKRKLRIVCKAGAVFLAALAGACAVFYLYQNRRPPYRRLDPAELRHHVETLARQGQSPEAYVLARFAAHPVVLLGEPHRVREHYQFVARLLDPLAQGGVTALAMELFHVAAQGDIDRLLASTDFDPRLARRVVLNAYPGFYYQELHDLVHEAWRVNRSGHPLALLETDGIGPEELRALLDVRGLEEVFAPGG